MMRIYSRNSNTIYTVEILRRGVFIPVAIQVHVGAKDKRTCG
jgi:hypothetical protein